MAAEMAEQPACLADLVGRRATLRRAIAGVLPPVHVGTILVARGSSDHASTTGQYLIAAASGRPVGLASPSILSHYKSTVDFAGYLVIATSQSGHTPEIVRYVETARAAGAMTLAITNDAESPLAGAAHLALDLRVGAEIAVPATKTVTAQLLAFALVADAIGPVDFTVAHLEALPGHVAAVLADLAPVEEVALALAPRERMITVARGILYGAALETALKLEETTGLLVAGYSAADLRHGPIAIARPGLAAIAFSVPGPTHRDVLDVCALLDTRGCDVFLASTDVRSELPLPQVPEALAPVLAVVRGQQLAWLLARRLGRDPDRPPGLTKVTLT